MSAHCMVCSSEVGKGAVHCTASAKQKAEDAVFCQGCFYKELLEWAYDEGYKPGITYDLRDDDDDDYEPETEEEEEKREEVEEETDEDEQGSSTQ